MTDFDLAVTDALLSTTRAVRKRLDLERPVPRGIINECLELSQQAPTGSNRQGWSWVVVTDAEKRAALGDMYHRGAMAYLAQAETDALREVRETAAALAVEATTRLIKDNLDEARANDMIERSIRELGEKMH